MTEKQFASVTVSLWRLHQRVSKFQNTTGVPTEITAQAVNETKKEIRAALAKLTKQVLH